MSDDQPVEQHPDKKPLVRRSSVEHRIGVQIDADGNKQVTHAQSRTFPPEHVELPPDLNLEDLGKGRVVTFSGTIFIPDEERAEE